MKYNAIIKKFFSILFFLFILEGGFAAPPVQRPAEVKPKGQESPATPVPPGEVKAPPKKSFPSRVTVSASPSFSLPMSRIADYVGPLMGLDVRASWDKISWKGITPYTGAGFAFGSGKEHMDSYFHAGPGLGIFRTFLIKQMAIQPYTEGGFLWGSIARKDAEPFSLSLPFAEAGMSFGWFFPGTAWNGLLHSVEFSAGYKKVFSELQSDYLTLRLGVSFIF